MTYDEFIHSHGDELKLEAAPEIAKIYYSDKYMNDACRSPGDISDKEYVQEVKSLYDVFCNIRADEKEHASTMSNLLII